MRKEKARAELAAPGLCRSREFSESFVPLLSYFSTFW